MKLVKHTISILIYHITITAHKNDSLHKDLIQFTLISLSTFKNETGTFLIIMIIYNALTTGVLSKDPNASPQTTMAAP